MYVKEGKYENCIIRTHIEKANVDGDCVLRSARLYPRAARQLVNPRSQKRRFFQKSLDLGHLLVLNKKREISCVDCLRKLILIKELDCHSRCPDLNRNRSSKDLPNVILPGFSTLLFLLATIAASLLIR